MKKVLDKMAKQLNQYDAASLKSLWEEYAAKVADFEPTQRWEEAALALCMIQGVLWKNQLFNTKMLNDVKLGYDSKENEFNVDLEYQSGRVQEDTPPQKENKNALLKGNSVATPLNKRRKVLKFER